MLARRLVARARRQRRFFDDLLLRNRILLAASAKRPRTSRAVPFVAPLAAPASHIAPAARPFEPASATMPPLQTAPSSASTWPETEQRGSSPALPTPTVRATRFPEPHLIPGPTAAPTIRPGSVQTQQTSPRAEALPTNEAPTAPSPVHFSPTSSAQTNQRQALAGIPEQDAPSTAAAAAASPRTAFPVPSSPATATATTPLQTEGLPPAAVASVSNPNDAWPAPAQSTTTTSESTQHEPLPSLDTITATPPTPPTPIPVTMGNTTATAPPGLDPIQTAPPLNTAPAATPDAVPPGPTAAPISAASAAVAPSTAEPGQVTAATATQPADTPEMPSTAASLPPISHPPAGTDPSLPTTVASPKADATQVPPTVAPAATATNAPTMATAAPAEQPRRRGARIQYQNTAPLHTDLEAPEARQERRMEEPVAAPSVAQEADQILPGAPSPAAPEVAPSQPTSQPQSELSEPPMPSEVARAIATLAAESATPNPAPPTVPALPTETTRRRSRFEEIGVRTTQPLSVASADQSEPPAEAPRSILDLLGEPVDRTPLEWGRLLFEATAPKANRSAASAPVSTPASTATTSRMQPPAAPVNTSPAAQAAQVLPPPGQPRRFARPIVAQPAVSPSPFRPVGVNDNAGADGQVAASAQGETASQAAPTPVSVASVASSAAPASTGGTVSRSPRVVAPVTRPSSPPPALAVQHQLDDKQQPLGAQRAEQWGDLPAPWEPLPIWSGSAETSSPAQSEPTASPSVIARSPIERASEAAPTPAPAPPPAQGQPTQDLDALARQVYAVLKQRLADERRRLG